MNSLKSQKAGNLYSIVWDIKASQSLRQIFEYYKPKSLKAANTVKNDILKSVSSLYNPPKYSFDPDLGEPFRRIVSRKRYRIIYFQDTKLGRIEILYIFDAVQSSGKLDILKEK